MGAASWHLCVRGSGIMSSHPQRKVHLRECSGVHVCGSAPDDPVQPSRGVYSCSFIFIKVLHTWRYKKHSDTTKGSKTCSGCLFPFPFYTLVLFPGKSYLCLGFRFFIVVTNMSPPLYTLFQVQWEEEVGSPVPLTTSPLSSNFHSFNYCLSFLWLLA